MAIDRKGLGEKLAAFLSDQCWQCDATGPGTAQIVCLRGCHINEDGGLSAFGDPRAYTDRYDDVMVVFGQKKHGAAYLEAFAATAKPGRYWIHHPDYAASNKGCPTVQPGQYRYVRGPHRGHEALRQAYNAPVCVIRDLDDDERLEYTDRACYPTDTGINIHSSTGTGLKVGANSSGCQVIWGGWGGKPWVTFHDIVYKVAKSQTVFHYALADFAFFGEWHDHPDQRETAYANLWFGSSGERVEELQKRLAAKGYYGSQMVDGEFGRVTDEGVRCLQKALGLWPDGVVTPDLMGKLRA